MTAQDRANIFTDDDEDLVSTVAVLAYATWFYISEYRSLTGSNVQFALIGSLIVVAVVCSAVFVIGLHKKNYKMVYMFYWFSILEVLITLGLMVWELIDVFRRPYWLRADYLHHLVHLTLQFVFNTLLPIYFIILIRSEWLAIKGEGEQPATTAADDTCVVLDAPVAKEQDQRYHFAYSSPGFEHKANTSPLFPVEELRIERLRQKLGK